MRMLDKHLFAPLEKERLTSKSSKKADGFWNSVESASRRIRDVDAELELNHSVAAGSDALI